MIHPQHAQPERIEGLRILRWFALVAAFAFAVVLIHFSHLAS
jgi:putative copper export protein